MPWQVCRSPYTAVAWVAFLPGLLREREQFAAETRDFDACIGRYPDQVIEPMRLARELVKERDSARAAEREKKLRSDLGKVCRFYRSTPWLVRSKTKQLMYVGKVRPCDFKSDGILKRGFEYVAVAALPYKEVAGFLFGRNSRKEETVKKAHQSVAEEPKGKAGRKGRQN